MCLSAAPAAHLRMPQVVTDLQWLPGVEVSHRGKVTKLPDGSKECNFFATIAADGKVGPHGAVP